MTFLQRMIARLRRTPEPSPPAGRPDLGGAMRGLAAQMRRHGALEARYSAPDSRFSSTRKMSEERALDDDVERDRLERARRLAERKKRPE